MCITVNSKIYVFAVLQRLFRRVSYLCRESYGQTLAIASASSPLYASDDAVAMADISNFKTTKNMDKRVAPSRIEYNCEFEPLWLTIGSGNRR